jgi:hypothetical protein
MAIALFPRHAESRPPISGKGSALLAHACQKLTLQRLQGCFVHEPNLGSLEGQDPIRLLTGELTINAHFGEFLPRK